MSSGLIHSCIEYLRAAFADGATARPLFDITGATDNPTPAIVTGTNQRYTVLGMVDGQTCYARTHVRLPSDLYVDGGLKARILWSTSATSGNARWTIETAFVMAIDGDQDDLDPAFNTATAVVTAAAASAAHLIASVFSALDTTDMRPGALLLLRIGRAPGHASDTLGATANLIGLELEYQRRMVLP